MTHSTRTQLLSTHSYVGQSVKVSFGCICNAYYKYNVSNLQNVFSYFYTRTKLDAHALDRGCACKHWCCHLPEELATKPLRFRHHPFTDRNYFAMATCITNKFNLRFYKILFSASSLYWLTPGSNYRYIDFSKKFPQT